jgi:hypothetical protein
MIWEGRMTEAGMALIREARQSRISSLRWELKVYQ